MPAAEAYFLTAVSLASAAGIGVMLRHWFRSTHRVGKRLARHFKLDSSSEGQTTVLTGVVAGRDLRITIEPRTVRIPVKSRAASFSREEQRWFVQFGLDTQAPADGVVTYDSSAAANVWTGNARFDRAFRCSAASPLAMLAALSVETQSAMMQVGKLVLSKGRLTYCGGDEPLDPKQVLATVTAAAAWDVGEPLSTRDATALLTTPDAPLHLQARSFLHLIETAPDAFERHAAAGLRSNHWPLRMVVLSRIAATETVSADVLAHAEAPLNEHEAEALMDALERHGDEGCERPMLNALPSIPRTQRSAAIQWLKRNGSSASTTELDRVSRRYDWAEHADEAAAARKTIVERLDNGPDKGSLSLSAVGVEADIGQLSSQEADDGELALNTEVEEAPA